ncbi:hypothetical protein [Cupriavidus basilensis]|uniref:hypothetical protein n=1 Tax=Cupriavidus basilensis TaxID=68895 RepID=UPI00031A9A96|nr:hypothetical protein [Cupriavidus basilensis]
MKKAPAERRRHWLIRERVLAGSLYATRLQTPHLSHKVWLAADALAEALPARMD